MRFTEEEYQEYLARQESQDASHLGGLTPYIPPAEEGDEHTEQARLMRWVLQNEASEPRLRMLFAVPNGGYRPGRGGTTMREEGVRQGVPDLLMPVNARGCVGLAIEMKSRVTRGRVRKEQEWWLAQLRGEWWHTAVCWSAAEAVRELRWYLGYDADATG